MWSSHSDDSGHGLTSFLKQTFLLHSNFSAAHPPFLSDAQALCLLRENIVFIFEK